MSEAAPRAPDRAAIAEPAAVADAPVGAPVGRSPRASVMALQRQIGNAAVARILARDPQADGSQAPPGTPATTPKPPPRVDYVFLMGDPTADIFFANAQKYFQGQGTIVQTDSLTGIMAEIGRSKNPIGKLIIVSHAHESGSLQFKIDANDPDNRLDYDELKKANADGTLPTVDATKVDKDTQVIIRGCNIGRSKRMLNELDKAFGGATKVNAPTHEQEYGPDPSGAMSEKMSGYFVEEPGIPKTARSDTALQALFAAKYPFVKAKDWPALLKKKTVIADRQGPWEKTSLMPDDKAAAALAAFKDQLDAAHPPADGWAHKYKGRAASGADFDYTFESSRLVDGSPEKVELTITAPGATQAELEAPGRAEMARPEAYQFMPMKTTPGAAPGEKVFSVTAERSEWIVKHTTIKDAGKEINPPTSDTKWWGESDYAPPAPAPAPTP